MLNLQSTPREARLDIDACHACNDNCGWRLTWDDFIWDCETREVIEGIRWIACPYCNRDEHKPKPWDA